ncbi:hypothetical protein [Acinetobacter seifertii]|uniref:hypothetical protein n=1 Tax=Acinetobacter seifertii TaxID=1530123 RepID=UPI0019050263|nr:hypothetical protein [Acinetobacter seifertii]MBJ9425164.1 hypothetical protein [Acinetobacter seifertii]
MTNHHRVLNLIELIGDKKVLAVCKDMQNYQITNCEITQHCVDYRPKKIHNSERVFTLQELMDGLNEYSRLQNLEDRELRDLFEPIVRETEYFKTNGHWSNFEYKKGGYINMTIQAMYEIFLKIYNKN